MTNDLTDRKQWNYQYSESMAGGNLVTDLTWFGELIGGCSMWRVMFKSKTPNHTRQQKKANHTRTFFLHFYFTKSSPAPLSDVPVKEKKRFMFCNLINMLRNDMNHNLTVKSDISALMNIVEYNRPFDINQVVSFLCANVTFSVK